MAKAPAAPGAYLSEMYGVEPKEAARREANATLVGELRSSLFGSPLPGYSDVWIRHEPTYAVVVNAKPPYDADDFLERAPAAIRGDIEFVEVRRDRIEIARDQDRIIAAFRPLGGAWSGGYEVQHDRFRFTVGAAGQLDAFRNAVPADLRDATIVEVGAQPVPL